MTESARVRIGRQSVDKQRSEQSPRDGEVHIMPVQGNIYMLVADGTNITVSVGPEGLAVVNTGTADMSEKILAALKQLASSAVRPARPNNCSGDNCPGNLGLGEPVHQYRDRIAGSPKPIRYIINTSAAPEHIGGNQKIASAGFFPRTGGFGSAIDNIGRAALVHGPRKCSAQDEHAGRRINRRFPRWRCRRIPTSTNSSNFPSISTAKP